MTIFSAVLATLLLLSGECQGDKILFLLPLASRSHVHVFEPLMRALGERGHEVVTLSPIQSSNMSSTVRQIQLISVEDFTGSMQNVFEMRRIGTFGQMFNFSAWDDMEVACNKAGSHPKLHELLQNEKFDLVIVDVILNFCILGVIPITKAPSILVSTCSPPSLISNVVGNRLPPSFVPSLFMNFGDRMAFKERFVNTVTEFLLTVIWDWMQLIKNEPTYRRNLPGGEDLPGIHEIQQNASMIFANSHFTMNYPRPLLPDVVEVGGMHTRPAKKLPKDLDEFLGDSGDDGFIFFSLGSIVKPQDMPEKTRKVFINVFGRLKQRVLWKWNGDEMADLPKNVMISKWLPQQDILGHPKIKVFMSHGGLLSTQESVYHGVPVLGMPVFGDQDLNVRQAETAGYAKFVEILDLTEEALESTLKELLSNPTYTKRVKELSKLVKDLPQAPLDKAIYWTEYVLRHKGAVHLRSAARYLNFFQYYVLDVIAVLLVILLGITFLIYQSCKCCCRRMFCKNKNSDVKNKRE